MNKHNDRLFLELALEEAEKALKENTYPVGAVIVDEHNQIISRGRNRVHPAQDVTAHAEIEAIRNAGSSIFKAKINRGNLTLYTSLEPCPMCTGGILFAKINRVVWLLNDDEGFGGYKKFRDAKIFDQKFGEIEAIEEPYEDLKVRQVRLMEMWSANANHITNLRKGINPTECHEHTGVNR